MRQGPIGVFDSGYGGLTILKEFVLLLPKYDYLYLGDNARAPYGTRSFETVYQYTLECVKNQCAILCTAGINFRMLLQIYFKAFSNYRTLRNHIDVFRNIFFNFAQQEWIVRTGEQQGINIGRMAQKVEEVFLYEIIGAFIFMFIVLNNGNPHRASFLVDNCIWKKFFYLQFIGV